MMTWTTMQQIFTACVAVAVVVFATGRMWQRMRRGELGDFRLSPLQQIAVDLANLSKMVEREIASLRAQIGTQYTDVVQKVLAHHVSIRELIDSDNSEYERLTEKFYSKEMIDRMRVESERDRVTLREDVDMLKTAILRPNGHAFARSEGTAAGVEQERRREERKG